MSPNDLEAARRIPERGGEPFYCRLRQPERPENLINNQIAFTILSSRRRGLFGSKSFPPALRLRRTASLPWYLGDPTTCATATIGRRAGDQRRCRALLKVQAKIMLHHPCSDAMAFRAQAPAADHRVGRIMARAADKSATADIAELIAGPPGYGA